MLHVSTPPHFVFHYFLYYVGLSTLSSFVILVFLSQEIREREKAKEAARLVVDSHVHRRATQIEIRPKYLLPDTNCYIDHLKCEYVVVKLGGKLFFGALLTPTCSHSLSFLCPLISHSVDCHPRGVKDDLGHAIDCARRTGGPRQGLQTGVGKES